MSNALLVVLLAALSGACSAQRPGHGHPVATVAPPVPAQCSDLDPGACQSSAPPNADAGAPVVPSGTGGAPPQGGTGGEATAPGVDAGELPDSGSGPARPVTVLPEPTSDDASYIFDDSEIRTYNVVIDPKDLQTIDADPSAETYVPAHLEFEGTSYGPFAARYKGNVSGYQPPCTLAGPGTPKFGKCSIKVAFDQPDSTARFFGLKKMNFTATNADPSFLRERLGYSLFREMGIAAPRNAYAHVQVNGVAVGLYVVDEQIDDRFTKHRFSDGGKGNIYKEVWPMYNDASTYEAALESNRKNPSATGILALKAAIDAGPDATEMLIDRMYTMAFVAVDRVIASDDGPFHWWCAAISQGNNPGPFGNHNYYWYEAISANRLWLIPWDLDLSFSGNVQTHIVTPWNMTAPCECVDTVDSGVQRPAACDPLVQDFIGWMDDYNAKVDEFIAGPFSADGVNAKLDAWSNQITDAVTKYSGLNGAPTVVEWKAGVSSLRSTIDTLRKNRGYKY